MNGPWSPLRRAGAHDSEGREAKPPSAGTLAGCKAGALLARSGWRHWLRHPWQAVLAIAGIAMGVAMVVAVDLASQSARASYLWSAETLAGKATHHILGVTGNLPDSLYARLRLAGLRDAEGNPVPMTPVLEFHATLGRDPPKPFRLVGVDPFSSKEFGAFGLVEAQVAGSGPGGGLSALLSEPGAVLLSAATASRLGLEPGAALTIRSGRTGNKDADRPAHLIGVLEPRNTLAKTLVDDLILADLATAQEILGRMGRISRIELGIPAPGSTGNPKGELAPAIEALLPPDALLSPANARAQTLDSMTRAFRINLTALSLLAMLVGAFLIYNTMAFSVAQRWNLLGTLRSLGAEPRDIARLVCREAVALSLVGTALGILGGILLGRGLVTMVARTLNDLYFSAHVTGLRIEPGILVKGIVLGVGMGLLASLGPAWQASNIRPRILLTRSAQESGLLRRLPLLNGLGAAAALIAALLAWMPGGSLLAGFASLAFAVFAWSLWTPGMLRRFSAAGAWAAGRIAGATPGAFSTLARMAIREVGASLSRTGVAAAALMTALSVTVAMGVMVDSFRRAVHDWLDSVLIADFYVAAPRNESGRMQGRLLSSWVEKAAAMPGVAGATTYLSASVQGRDSRPVQILALDMDVRSRRAFTFLEGDSARAWEAFLAKPACGVLISEPYAYRHGLHPGSNLELPTREGPRTFPVAGVFSDYGSDQGVVIMDRACFASHWEAEGFTSLALFADPEAGPEALGRALASLPGSEAVEIHPSRALRSASLEIFDRTFAITSVLRLAAVLVALIGLIGALAALELERAPETALLRALGLTPLQTWGLATAQAAFLGLVTGLLAIPLGLAQAGLLIHVINRRSFGWTMPMQADPWICAQAVILGLAAALVAAALPAWKMSRAVTARALREE